jgi:hypothetical protein
MSNQLQLQTECPICMDPFEVGNTNNLVVTECGHTFHCNCLMQNVAHNGFDCPYCRTEMASVPDDESESSFETYDSNESEDNSVEPYEYDALTSFRMFHQRVNEDEIEEEEEEEENNERIISDDADTVMQTPDATYISNKLQERGITFEDLVKNLISVEHIDKINREDYYHRGSEVYGQFRAIISQFRPQRQTQVQTQVQTINLHTDEYDNEYPIYERIYE